MSSELKEAKTMSAALEKALADIRSKDINEYHAIHKSEVEDLTDSWTEDITEDIDIAIHDNLGRSINTAELLEKLKKENSERKTQMNSYTAAQWMFDNRNGILQTTSAYATKQTLVSADLFDRFEFLYHWFAVLEDIADKAESDYEDEDAVDAETRNKDSDEEDADPRYSPQSPTYSPTSPKKKGQ